jgi:hypothetical protein
VSYIRSITMDSWNDNQVNMMKYGGNRNLRELLEVYEINQAKTDKSILYNSRLLDFYRKHLKAKVNKENFDRMPPEKSEALKGLSIDSNYNPNIPDSAKFSSVSKSGIKNYTSDEKTSFGSVSSSSEEDSGFIGNLNSWMGKAINSAKYVADKVGDFEIGNKIMTTGNAITETGSNIVNKGTEVAVRNYIKNY